MPEYQLVLVGTGGDWHWGSDDQRELTMNMNVLSQRDLGEIMAGHFTVPENPIVVGLSGCNRGNGRGKLGGLNRVSGLGGLGRIGQSACSPAFSPGNCASAGGYYDDDNEVCVCPSGSTPTIASTTPVTTPPTTTTGTCGTNPCSWMDYIWAGQPCLNWYAQCNPTSPFYIANTQGALSAIGGAAGSAVGSTAGGLFAGLAASMGIPVVAVYAGLGLLAYVIITK